MNDEYELGTIIAEMIFDGLSDDDITEYIENLTKEVRQEFNQKLKIPETNKG